MPIIEYSNKLITAKLSKNIGPIEYVVLRIVDLSEKIKNIMLQMKTSLKTVMKNTFTGEFTLTLSHFINIEEYMPFIIKKSMQLKPTAIACGLIKLKSTIRYPDKWLFIIRVPITNVTIPIADAYNAILEIISLVITEINIEIFLDENTNTLSNGKRKW